MKNPLTVSILAVALTLGTVVQANAWERNVSKSGPRGDSSVTASGNCADGACEREKVRTGPNGNSVTRDGNASCADGKCTTTRNTTGPRGESVTRDSNISR